MAGIMRCILWPEDFAKHGHHVEADKILALRGVIDKRPGSEDANFIVNELIPLENLESRYTKGIVVRIDERNHAAEGTYCHRRPACELNGRPTLELQTHVA